MADVSLSSDAWSSEFFDYLESNGLGDNGYSVPVGTSAQQSPLPWQNLNQLHVEFTEDVHVDASDLILSGFNHVQYSFVDFQYKPETRVATWTLSSPLGKDSYWIDLNADGLDPIRSLAGVALDGDWTNSSSTFVSGDGTAGEDFGFSFRVLPGDALGINLLEYNNLNTIYYRVGLDTGDSGYLAKADIDGDGVIENSDWEVVWSNYYDSAPSNAPVGASNDAPTAAAFQYASISDDSIDETFSLWDSFKDAEDTDSQLTYSVLSNSDPSLFDSVTIDTVNGDLVVNTAQGASGRAEVVVAATDSGGLTVTATFWIDVDRPNAGPVISVTTTDGGQGLWEIEGWVTDADDDVEDMYVVLSGLIEVRVSVSETGYFYYSVLLDPEEGGAMWATVSDSCGGSDQDYFEIGWV